MLTWHNQRPRHGQVIQVELPTGLIETGTYYEDGVDGVVEWADGSAMDVDEYRDTTLWQPAPSGVEVIDEN